MRIFGLEIQRLDAQASERQAVKQMCQYVDVFGGICKKEAVYRCAKCRLHLCDVDAYVDALSKHRQKRYCADCLFDL